MPTPPGSPGMYFRLLRGEFELKWVCGDGSSERVGRCCATRITAVILGQSPSFYPKCLPTGSDAFTWDKVTGLGAIKEVSSDLSAGRGSRSARKEVRQEEVSRGQILG